MNTTTFTINDETAIVNQIKVCQSNLEMLNDFAPNHPLVLKNINKMLDLVAIFEAIQSNK